MTEHGSSGSPLDSSYQEKIAQVSERLSSSSFRADVEFKRASSAMARVLSLKEFELWANLGFELGNISGRSWDCATEYFKSSPIVMEIEVFAFLDLHQWVGHGKELAAISAEAAASYFKHSPRFINEVDLWSLDKWVQLGRRLLDDHWKSSKLTSAYFRTSLECLPIFGLKGMEEWVKVAAALSSHSHDVGQRFLEDSRLWFAPLTDAEREKVLQISMAMAADDYTSIPKFFPLLELHQKKVKTEVRKPLYEICLNIAAQSAEDAIAFLESAPLVLSRIESKDQIHLAALGSKLSDISWEAAMEYVNNLPEILATLPAHKVPPWFEAGMEVTTENAHAGTAYYAMESRRSQEEITRLQRTVHLEDINRLLNLYAEGLTARKLKIKKLEKESDLPATALPTTDGEYIQLPDKVAEYEDYTKNFKWYKVATAHQAGYYEYDTFRFSIRALKETGLGEIPRGLREKVARSERNDLEGFFQMFNEPPLASMLFRLMEDGRVDYLLRTNYRGLKRDMLPIMEHAMAERPPLRSLTPRRAALEMLLHITTLGEVRENLDPASEVFYNFIRGEVQRVFDTNATVSDSALAAARVYPLIKKLPDMKGLRKEIIEALAERLGNYDGEIDELLDMLLAEAEAGDTLEDLEGGDPYLLDVLEFRGDTKPEEVQKLMKLKEIKDNIDKLNEHGVPLPLDLLKELLKMGAEMDIIGMDEEDLDSSSGLFITNIDGLSEIPAYKKVKEMLEEEPETLQQLLYGDIGINDPLESIYYYDEWDHLIDDYRSKWCKLKELSPGDGDTQFVEETLKDNSELINVIRRQFQLLRPEMFRKVKKLESGEEIDIDSAIQAVIDKRCNLTPSEKVYQRRDKRERDVSALFLLDVSASTDEEVEKNTPALPTADTSWKDDKYSNPGYARGGGGPPPPPEPSKKGKRIIDIEKEALILMAEALESIGDEYAVFGFSGYGRDNVEFFTIKEFPERYSDKVKGRIGAIRPQRSTRMGPAIRHAISKLDKSDSRLKLLILLSDGYPQDFDYGKDRTSKEYGIEDTAKALHEAREKNIHPFLITVDPAGNDYLKDMCGKNDYMVIEKVSSLPQELLRTYRTLTYR